MLLTAPEWLEASGNEALATMRTVGLSVGLRVTQQSAGRWEWYAENSRIEAKIGWSRSRSEAMHMARLAAHALTIPFYVAASKARPPSPAETGVLVFEGKPRSPVTIASVPATGIKLQPSGSVA